MLQEKYASQRIHKKADMHLPAEFHQAVADAKNLPERPNNMALLKIYALFKQASVGDATSERPGMNDLVSRAKYDAWDALKGIGREETMMRAVHRPD